MSDRPTILTPDDAALARAGQMLRAGGLVGMPTETVYGLACNALDDQAVARVFEAKARPTFDPLIVHCVDAAEAKRYAADWPDVADRLAAAFWPGPLTLVLPKRTVGGRAIGDLVTAGLPNVALRVPAHPIARRLIDAADRPLAAPSANRFGRISPTRAEHVADELAGRLDLILDGGPCQTGVESTVVACLDPDGPRVLRPGGVTREQLREAIGFEPTAAERDRADDDQAQRGRASPGMLDRHYAPATPLLLFETLDDAAAHRLAQPDAPEDRVAHAALAWQRVPPALQHLPHAVLTPTGDPVEAAANLFAALRRLDAAGVEAILAERAPDRGLGRVINDRLQRAAQSPTT